jgi:hypothetical protein
VGVGVDDDGTHVRLFGLDDWYRTEADAARADYDGTDRAR